VTDAASGVMSHQYNAFGELKQTTNAAGNVVASVTYVDARGLRTGLNDMSLGNWTFVPKCPGRSREPEGCEGSDDRSADDV
jgi:hypothetical protein